MTAAGIVKQLRPLGSDSYRRILANHGIPEPTLGVKVEELKKFQKRIKKDYKLSLDLYDTGIYDARYLAGLIADGSRMTKQDLRGWLAGSNGVHACGNIIAAVAAESPHGRELAMEWIESKDAGTAQAGWATLTSLVAITDDADLELPELERLIKRVEKTIQQQPNYVRYSMNSFLIAVGIHVRALTELATDAGEKIGKVTVDMGKTACKVPYAPEYIEKARKRGVIGKKRASAMC